MHDRASYPWIADDDFAPALICTIAHMTLAGSERAKPKLRITTRYHAEKPVKPWIWTVPVTVTRLPVTRCQICRRTVASRAGPTGSAS